MDTKKIAFITCVNNPQEYEEALYYISRLNVPEGYTTETIHVCEAPGMAAGYNAAMRDSDAKYKVYLHQDVFLVYRDFIAEMLAVFENHADIGMIGCIGCDSLPLHAQAVTAWNVGRVCHNCIPMCMERYQNADKTPVIAEALDGLLLATQYDVTWREDLFDGWDFYDVSQCFEMRRAGYRTAVPYQEHIWCYHDNTYSKMGSYQKYCARFVDEYQDIKPFRHLELRDEKREFDALKEESREAMRHLADAGNREELCRIFSEEENRGYLHLREFEVLAEIDRRECREGKRLFWTEGDDFGSLTEKLADLRFALKRIEYGADSDAASEYIRAHYSRQAADAVAEVYVGKLC